MLRRVGMNVVLSVIESNFKLNTNKYDEKTLKTKRVFHILKLNQLKHENYPL